VTKILKYVRDMRSLRGDHSVLSFEWTCYVIASMTLNIVYIRKLISQCSSPISCPETRIGTVDNVNHKSVIRHLRFLYISRHFENIEWIELYWQ